MKVSIETVKSVFETHMDRYYAYYADLLSHLQYEDAQQVYFAMDEATFAAGQWVTVTVNEEETLVDIQGNTASFDEALVYAKSTDRPVLLRLDTQTACEIGERYTLHQKRESGFGNEGLFGCASKTGYTPTQSISVRSATAEDVPYLASLPLTEWGNMPIVIRFSKNLEQVLLAEWKGELVGYLIYASSHEEYCDIVNVMTHTMRRGMGVGKALVGAFVNITLEKGCIPYYGEAKSAASAALAMSMGFEQLQPAKAVYEVE